MSSSTAEDLEGFEADRELRKIGELGREWKLRHMRKADMEVRLLSPRSWKRSDGRGRSICSGSSSSGLGCSTSPTRPPKSA